MSGTPQIRTALMENLKDLHLPAMRECFEQAAQQAEKETLSYEQYLLQLTQRECESRRRNRIATLLRESALPKEKTMVNFDLKRLPIKAGLQLKALTDGGFLDRKENLLVFGDPGAGKSHLLCALAHELIAPLCANISETSSPSTITVGRGKKSHLEKHEQDKFFFRCVGSFGADLSSRKR